MTGVRYIKQAIIASICDHPDKAAYHARAFSGDNLAQTTDALSSQAHQLNKADFFAPDDAGKMIIDTAGFWRNFDKFVEILNKSGERLELADFDVSLRKNEHHTLVESAVSHGGLGKLFTEQVWGGRFEEMERLWYRVPVTARRNTAQTDGVINQDIKRRMFEMEGKQTPESRLAKAGLTAADIHDAFTDNNKYNIVQNKLSQAGDYMRKEYLLLLDKSGDSVFAQKLAWDKYPDMAKTMLKHGEKLEVADLTRQVGKVRNVLARAADMQALDKVFTASLWEDRLEDMLYLWTLVLPGWRAPSLTDAKFDIAYGTAESLTFGKLVDANRTLTKADLLGPLNDVTAKDAKPVLPLGLKSTWDNMDVVRAGLKGAGEKLLLADLRTPSGQMGNSCFINAVKYGHFEKVVDICKDSGERLGVSDFLSKDMHGNTVLWMLSEQDALAKVFTPEIWVGRVQEMKDLWLHVRPADRSKLDFGQIEVAANQATLREKAAGGKFRMKK